MIFPPFSKVLGLIKPTCSQTHYFINIVVTFSVMEKVFSPWALCFSNLGSHSFSGFFLSFFANSTEVVRASKLSTAPPLSAAQLNGPRETLGDSSCEPESHFHRREIYGPYLLETFMDGWYKSRIEWIFFPMSINLWLGDWFLSNPSVTHLNCHLLIFYILA